MNTGFAIDVGSVAAQMLAPLSGMGTAIIALGAAAGILAIALAVVRYLGEPGVRSASELAGRIGRILLVLSIMVALATIIASADLGAPGGYVWEVM